jgi:hypothetical protein
LPKVARSGRFDASGKGSHHDHPAMIEPIRTVPLGMLEKGGWQITMQSAKFDLFH